MKKIIFTIVLASCTLALYAQTQYLEKLYAVQPAGSYPENMYNGNVLIQKPAASAPYINLSRSGYTRWSLGTVYSTNTFAIGQSTELETDFTAPAFTIRTDGNVGIGSNNPDYKLDLNLASATGIARIYNGSDYFKIGGLGSGTAYVAGNENIVAFGNINSYGSTTLHAGNQERLRINSSGNVGIGTTEPIGKLNVSKGFILSGWDGSAGDGVYDGYVIGYDGLNPVGFSNREFRIQQQLLSGSISTALLHNGYATVTTGSNLQYTQGNYSRFSGQVFDQNGNINFLVNAGAAGSGTNTIITPTTAMTIKYDGKVGIGINAPQYLLDVAGTIRAKEVIVTVNGFPDFVFEKTYNLPKLHDVDKFIQSNGHLPNIPSAKEVEKNGMSMADLQVKLLQKVEELTLYAINQQKEIETLKKALSEQKK